MISYSVNKRSKRQKAKGTGITGTEKKETATLQAGDLEASVAVVAAPVPPMVPLVPAPATHVLLTLRRVLVLVLVVAERQTLEPAHRALSRLALPGVLHRLPCRDTLTSGAPRLLVLAVDIHQARGMAPAVAPGLRADEAAVVESRLFNTGPTPISKAPPLSALALLAVALDEPRKFLLLAAPLPAEFLDLVSELRLIVAFFNVAPRGLASLLKLEGSALALFFVGLVGPNARVRL